MLTRNTDHGFFGTMTLKGRDAAQAWSIALPLIQAAANASAEAVRDYLDARGGRHFADEVENQMARGLGLETAIRAAVDIHMGWLIDANTTRAHGIPAGQPHLVGWVRSTRELSKRCSRKLRRSTSLSRRPSGAGPIARTSTTCPFTPSSARCARRLRRGRQSIDQSTGAALDQVAKISVRKLIAFCPEAAAPLHLCAQRRAKPVSVVAPW